MNTRKLAFQKLEALRRFLAELRTTHVDSLSKYYHESSNGFARKQDNLKLSLASTSTCLASLMAAGLWDSPVCQAWKDRTDDLVDGLLSAELQSAQLTGTVFTIAFVVEALILLRENGAVLDADQQSSLIKANEELDQSLKDRSHPGAVSVKEYPPTAYVTQLVVRVLDRQNALDPGLREQVRDWSVGEINRQIALFANDEKTADIYALAYATILMAQLFPPGESTPEQVRLAHSALDLLFKKQLPDGSWPLGRPLFHYPEAGNAYCFEYEMLVQLLSTSSLQALLLEYLDQLGKAAYALETRAFRFQLGQLAWASGHHPQSKGPESWSTASVFHFLYALDRVVAEAIRRTVFAHLDQEYRPVKSSDTACTIFTSDFLDSNVDTGDSSESLKKVVDKFVLDIAKNSAAISSGRPLHDPPAMSAIFFGPPGTSKTHLARMVAKYLGWPYLAIDPSHLVRDGMDKVQSQANRLFNMLAAAEQIVVLFDEFDEMVRERGAVGVEAISRFLTTTMLPKLTTINERRKIVFILATNHIEQFDFAISRLGRFDRIIQIMPPTGAEKKRKWPTLARLSTDCKADLELLTHSECQKLVEVVNGGAALEDAFTKAIANCTLRRIARVEANGTPVNWDRECSIQRQYIRL